MQWVLQTNDLPDGQTEKMQEALTERSQNWFQIQIEFTNNEIVMNVDAIDFNNPSYFYGSVQMVQTLYKHGKVSPLYYTPTMFDPRNWVNMRDDLLNNDVTEITVEKLRSTWVNEVTFIKPVNDKIFTGMVLEPTKDDHDNWIREYATVNSNEPIILSSYKKLDKEWRYFIIDGEVITGSQYRKDGYKAIRGPITTQDWAAAVERLLNGCLLRR